MFAKKTGELPAAVGVSLFLEKFVGCVEDVKDLVAAGRVEVSQIVAGKHMFFTSYWLGVIFSIYIT